MKRRDLLKYISITPLAGASIVGGFSTANAAPMATPLAAAMKRAAKELNIPIEWGGDWVSFPDGPHYQLPRKEYP